jgi:prepilin-type N-terminal cleavage/methylation domain-containing protein
MFDVGCWIAGRALSRAACDARRGHRRPRLERVASDAAKFNIHHRTSNIQIPADGFTLLEVILALVILGGALVVLGEVTQLASRSAMEARAETQAQVLAASVMDQVLAGAIPRENTSRQALEVDDDTPWLYSLTVGTSPITGIVPIEIVVEQDLEARLNPVKFRLVRWTPTTLETPETSGGGFMGGAAGGGTQGGMQGGGQAGMGDMMQ